MLNEYQAEAKSSRRETSKFFCSFIIELPLRIMGQPADHLNIMPARRHLTAIFAGASQLGRIVEAVD